MLTEEQIVARWDRLDTELKTELKSGFTETHEQLLKFGGRLTEVEQIVSRRHDPAPGGGALITAGATVVASPEFKSFGSQRRGKFSVNVKAITSASTSGGALAPPDRSASPALMGRRTLSIRQLLGSVPTSSNLIEYPRQSVRTNLAAVVTEGSAKPESNYEFVLANAPVRTIAHWVPASRQIMDDAPQLQATIDSELRYGLELEEEDEILNGDGTGSHLHGIIPQASAYNSAFTVEAPTQFDTLLKAILQSELAGFPANVLILHPTDLARLLAIKDAEERYIASAGPFSGPLNSIWNVPVATSQAIAETKFLVGSTFATTLYDRMQAEVVISTEHDDFFTRNLVAIRAESRLALAVRRPESWVYGDFDTATG